MPTNFSYFIIFITVASIGLLFSYIFYRIDIEKAKIQKQKIDNIISFCKKPHTFSEFKNKFFTISEIDYMELLDINFDIKNCNENTELVVLLYHTDKVIENILNNKIDNFCNKKIGYLKLNDVII